MSENSRLKKLVSEQSAQDVETVQKQAQQVLQENRILIKEQQMVRYYFYLDFYPWGTFKLPGILEPFNLYFELTFS